MVTAYIDYLSAVLLFGPFLQTFVAVASETSTFRNGWLILAEAAGGEEI
jgi:hypothetical protein